MAAEYKFLGETEGTDKTKIEIARNMLKDDVDYEIIAKYTGLSKEEIEKLNN